MSRDLVDPELLGPLDAFPEFRLNDETLAGYRSGLASALPGPESYARDDVHIERRRIDGPAGAPPLDIILFRPACDEPIPALLYIHGGGYVLGTAEDVAPGAVRIASEVGCLVVSVEYRLAPETPAPGALEDCYTALTWIAREAKALGVDPHRIAVTGDSAGGGLAASLALLARDRGECRLCFQLLNYPMLDDRTCAEGDTNPHTGHLIWTREANAFGWRALLGRTPGGDDVTAYEAAARATDLAGLPPTFISVGMLDLFVEENLAYAARLIRAGVPTELHVYPRAYHGFEMAPAARLTREAIVARDNALRRAFETPSTSGGEIAE